MIGNWLDASSTSNLHIQTYVKGFIDMSGGNVILRNNSSIYGNTGDISMGGRLLIGGDVSFNAKLFVNGDASLNSRVLVATDVSLGGRMFIQGTTFQTGDVSMNSRMYVAGISIHAGDASFNNRVLVGTDVSLGGRMFIQGTTFQTGDVSMNSRLYVAGISILNGDVSVNSRVLVSSDVSLGGRLFVSGNTELSGNLLIKGGLTVQQLQNQNIINTTTSNYQLIVSEDLSLNGRLFASGDVSLNSRLYVAGTSIHVGDASFNNRVLVGSDVSLGGRMFIQGTTFQTGDVSMNSRLYVAGTSIHVGDASFNNRVLVGSDVSLGGRIFIPSNGSLIIGGVPFTGGAFTGGTVANDISANSKLFVGGDVSMNRNLYVANNVGFGVSGSIFNLDVSGTVNLCGTVNPITLVDGSVLLSNTPPLDFSNNFALTWSQVATPRAWKSVAMSANGQYQTAVVSSGANIYRSGNFGVTWTQITTSLVYESVAMSANGQYQTAVASSGFIYRSINFGVTWSQATSGSTRNWYSVAMSANGQYQTAVVYGGLIWRSIDFGVNWSSVATTLNWYSVSMSANGQYQTAVVNNGFIWRSIDFGVTWSPVAEYQIWRTVAMSANGQYQTAVCGNIFRSIDFGVTWTQITTSLVYESVAMSANGQYQTAVASSGFIYRSIDFGVTWTQATFDAIRNWYSIAMSANGQYISAAAASTMGDYIYTSVTPYGPSSFSSIVGDVSMNRNLYVANNVGFGVSGSIFNLDVSGTVNLSGPVNPITLLDGSVLLSNTPAFDFSNNFAVTWSQSTSDATQFWRSVTISANGQYQTAIVGGMLAGYIYRSIDFGVTWSPVASSLTWYSVAMSANGQYQTAVVSSGFIYRSIDFGATWSQATSVTTRNWYSVAISANGQYQTAVVYGGLIWRSIDFGVNWSSVATTLNWYSVSMSANGQYQTAVVNNGYIWRSIDFGVTWSQATFDLGRTWRSVAISANGQYQTAVVNSGYIYRSIDFGVNWSQVASTLNWLSVAMTANGQYQTAVASIAYIYRSIDFGVTWSPVASSQNWFSVAMSANGQYQTAVVVGGYIYTSVTPYGPSSFSSIVGDVSMGGRLFVAGNTELSGNLLIKGGLTVQQLQNQNIINTTTSNYQLIVSEDISLNGRLFASGDVSLNSRLYVTGTSVLNGDASFNNRVLVGSDVSLGGRIFIPSNSSLIIGGVAFTGSSVFTGGTVANDISANSKLFVGGDVSLNSRMYVAGVSIHGGDANFNTRVIVSSDVSLGGRLFVKGTTELTGAITNTGGISGTGAITTTGILSVTGSSDASFNNRVLVGSDVSLGGRLFVSGNTELSGNLLLKGTLTVQQLQNQNIINTTTTNYQLIVSEDISLNGRLFASGDTSLNSRLYVAGTSTLNGDASFNSRVLVSSDVSLGGRLFVQGATYLSSLMVNGNPVTGGSSSTSTTSTDNWVLTNLVNPPPAIVFGNTVSTSTGIYVPWSYPTQVNVGFLNLYLPVLSKFSSTYTAKISGSVSQNNPIVTDQTTSSYINPNTGATGYITGIVLTNVDSNTGVQNIQFPQDANGTLRRAYVYYHANFNTLTTDPSNIITAWYSNNSTSTNKSTVNFNIFLAAGPPSAPGQPTFGTQSLSSNTVSVNVSYTAPQYADASNTSITTTAISSYTITYSTLGSTTRYGGNILHNPSPIVTGTAALTRGLTGLFPDCSYTVYVSAKNNSSYTSYGPNSIAGSLSTTNLLPISMTGTISFGGTSYSAKLVSDSTTIERLYISSSTSTLTSPAFVSPIHAIANRSSTATGLLDISASLTRGGSLIDGGPVLTYRGYSASNPGSVNKTINFITINGDLPTDSYSTNYQQGFYLQASTTVTLGTACFTASNQQSTVNLIQTQKNGGSSTSSTSFTYYYDTLTGNPTSVSTLHYLNGAQSSAATQVSGIWVLNGNTGVPITGNVTASNMGQYFFPSGTVINYTAGSSSVNESSLTNLKTALVGGNALATSITFSNSGLTYTNASYSKTIPFSATAYNLINGTSATSTAINAIVDYPSINLITNVFATSIQPITANTGGISGYRVYSGVPQAGTTVPTIQYSGASYYTIPYQNTWSIVSTTNTYSSYTNIDASSELMVAAGQIRSFDGIYMINYSPYYYGLSSANTLNYSTISQSGYRYATFVWAVNSSSGLSGTYGTLNVYLNGVSNNGNNTGSVVYADSTNKIQLFYRVEDTTSETTASLGGGNSSIASYWISINDNTGTTSAASGNNYFTSTTNPYFTAPTVTNGSSVKVSAALSAPIVSNQSYVSNGNIYIYVRLGLPMNTSYSLTSVSAYLSL